jgi:hypothetical protein
LATGITTRKLAKRAFDENHFSPLSVSGAWQPKTVGAHFD